MGRNDRHGIQAPRNAAHVFDAVAALCTLGCAASAVYLIANIVGDAPTEETAPSWLMLAAVVACTLSAIVIFSGAAIVMRWLAAMYETTTSEPPAYGNSADDLSALLDPSEPGSRPHR